MAYILSFIRNFQRVVEEAGSDLREPSATNFVHAARPNACFTAGDDSGPCLQVTVAMMCLLYQIYGFAY
jgi:hypothetical protein